MSRVSRATNSTRYGERPDAAQVELHRVLSDPELLADRIVRESPRYRSQHRQLALGETQPVAGVRPAVTDHPDPVMDGLLHRLPERRRKVGGMDTLHDVRDCASLEG